jgi:hypothetical protein
MDQLPTIKECFNCIDNWYYQYCNRKVDAGQYGEEYRELVSQMNEPCPVEWFKDDIERDKRNVRKVLKSVPLSRVKFIYSVFHSTWNRSEQEKLEHFCLSAGFYYRYGHSRKQFNKFIRLAKRYATTQDDTIFYAKAYFKKNGKFNREKSGFDL